MAAIKPSAERFEKLQSKAKEAAKAVEAFKIGMIVKYGSVAWAKRSDTKRFTALNARLAREERKFFDYLFAISPRNWETGVPVGWMRDHLTFADAVTRGALSEVPPPAFGSTEERSRAFARALDK